LNTSTVIAEASSASRSPAAAKAPISQRAARRELRGAYRDVMGEHYPAMSLLVVSALLEDRA